MSRRILRFFESLPFTVSPTSTAIMSERAAKSLTKWPFFLADAVLSGIAGYLLYRTLPPQNTWQLVLAAACLAAGAWGAWLWITPFLVEFRANVASSDSAELASAVEQIRDLQAVAGQIQLATTQWQSCQDLSARTVGAAREIADQIGAEGRQFMQFVEKAHDQDRANMRLEIEKLRRSESDWLQVTIRLLDHIYALNMAASRSGQQNIIQQLSQFQNACRDVARRVGLVPFVPQKDEAYNPQAHQLADTKEAAETKPEIAETVATGFTYQGQLLRKAVVILQKLQPDPQQELL
jgi:molecular chaperone GrpE (heat shock protein)